MKAGNTIPSTHKQPHSQLCFRTSLAWLILAQASFAQSPEGALSYSNSQSTLEEIVVTAQKREQSINDVPMSITAINRDSLQARGIVDTGDLDKIVPGFTSTVSNTDTPVYTLRGIGLYDSGIASSPTVSVYVDQVPLPFPVMTNGAALDLERVEVLKGPQGILFGQNSTGGAINYIAAKPTETFAAGGDLSYERFGKIDVESFVSGPLSDTMQARFAIRSIEGGAWQVSATRPDSYLGDTRELMGRLLLDWDPTDRLKLAFDINGNLNQSDTQAGQLQKVVPLGPGNVDPALLLQPIVNGNDRTADWTPSFPSLENDNFQQIAIRADYDASDTIKLIDLISYDHQKVDHFFDNDATAAPDSQGEDFGFIDSFNEEIRIASDTTRLHWVAGANYEYDNASDTELFYKGPNSGSQPFPNIPPFVHIAGTTAQKIDTYAVFANVEYVLVDRLTVHGGLRYTYSDRHAHICQTGQDADNALGRVFTELQQVLAEAGVKTTPVIPLSINDCFALTPVPDLSPQITGSDVSLSESNVSWRGGIDYKLEGGTLLYANASRGFKSGVISNIVGSSTSEYVPAKQESVDAYEAGFKAPFFDQRVRLNASAFYYNYTDKQVRTREIDPVFGLLELIVNVPKSRIWGIDGDLEARPISGLTLSVSGTYLNSGVTSDFNTVNQEGVSGNFRGSPLPYTPKVTAVGDVQYEWLTNGGVKPFVGSSLTYRSSDSTSFYTATAPAPDFQLPSSAILDMRAGVGAKDDRWRVALFARNVTDKYYWTFVYNVNETIFRMAGRPLTYGVTLSVRL